MSGYHKQVVVKEFLSTLIVLRCSAIRITQELVNPCFHRISDVRRFALNHCKRKSIHKTQDVRNDVLINSRHFELVGTKELVVLRMLEINDMNSLTLVTLTQVLHHRDALIDVSPYALVCFNKV